MTEDQENALVAREVATNRAAAELPAHTLDDVRGLRPEVHAHRHATDGVTTQKEQAMSLASGSLADNHRVHIKPENVESFEMNKLGVLYVNLTSGRQHVIEKGAPADEVYNALVANLGDEADVTAHTIRRTEVVAAK